MDSQMLLELEQEIENKIPDWIKQEPSLWQKLQYALRVSSSQGQAFDTFEQFIEWVDEDTSAEWFNGEVFFMSPASTKHQLIAGFLAKILSLYAEEKNLGLVLNAPFKMKLDGYGPEPDILFIKNENLSCLKENFLDGPADLIIEIVSPESIERDRGRKFVAYEAAGIEEYWLIDPNRQVAEFYQLEENGRYSVIQLDENGRFHSKVVTGFWIEPAWLWQHSLPATLKIMKVLKLI